MLYDSSDLEKLKIRKKNAKTFILNPIGLFSSGYERCIRKTNIDALKDIIICIQPFQMRLSIIY